MAAPDSAYQMPGDSDRPPHRISKLYYMGWPTAKWDAYQTAFKKLASTVDGVERQAAPWPDWALTTVIHTEEHWATVWRAVQCHESQMAIYGPLAHLSEDPVLIDTFIHDRDIHQETANQVFGDEGVIDRRRPLVRCRRCRGLWTTGGA